MGRETKIHDRSKPKGMRIFIYHLLSNRGTPRATVAIGEIGGVYARGFSLCSDSELRESGFIEKVGIEISRRRMFRAFNRCNDDLPVRRVEAVSIAKSVRKRMMYDGFFDYKCTYDVIPTAFEMKEL